MTGYGGYGALASGKPTGGSSDGEDSRDKTTENFLHDNNAPAPRATGLAGRLRRNSMSSLPEFVGLHRMYQSEKDDRDHLMADYLNLLREKYGDGIEAVPELIQIRDVFSKANRDQALPTPALMAWGDATFCKLNSWPKAEKVPERVRPAEIAKIFKALAAGVKYVTRDDDRAKYRITLGAQLFRGDSVFDTEELKQKYRDKEGSSYSYSEVIWVLGPDKEFYSHIAKLGRIHHSSFFGGEAILAGGIWVVEKGDIKWISGESGHYKPGLGPLIVALRRLCVANAIKSDAPVVKVWERITLAAPMNPDQLREIGPAAQSTREVRVSLDKLVKHPERYFQYDVGSKISQQEAPGRLENNAFKSPVPAGQAVSPGRGPGY